jgi:REP element-mobilizing transposase RayT
MTTARHTVVQEAFERTYHCIARCVRSSFLCGFDAYTGKDYEHRKEWVRSRIQHLARIFAIDVCGYAIMSNHLHLVLRNRPDLAAGWDHEEVARRWLTLFPRRRNPQTGAPEEPNELEIKALLCEPEKLERYRQRLNSISWFMRCTSEWLARRANREDNSHGRFWEGRFKCTALLDDSAILACLAYVDLNPIRAAIAETPEKSNFTSAQDRIIAQQAKTLLAQLKTVKAVVIAESSQALGELHAQANRANWLCPLQSTDGRKGFLNMELDQYFQLLEWTGRQLRSDKPGLIPSHLEPMLIRLEIEREAWLETVQHFGSHFHRVAGQLQHMVQAAREAGQRWFQGKRASAVAFSQPGS